MRLLLKAESVDHDTCVHCQRHMVKGDLSADKAKEILRDGEVHGHPLTKKQRGYFGAVAGGNSTLMKAQMDGDGELAHCDRCEKTSKPGASHCAHCGHTLVKSDAHPGFAAAAAEIERRQGVSNESARAILAAGARRASAGAKKANPHLKRVGGMHKATTFVKAGGEGSRGGRVIGHTKSGKPIYAGREAAHAYRSGQMKDYSAQDHRDAQAAHAETAEHATGRLPIEYGDEHGASRGSRSRDVKEYHREMADYHGGHAHRLEEAGRAAEAWKGNHKRVGFTETGKAVYGHGGRWNELHSTVQKHVAELHRGFTANEHRQAARLHAQHAEQHGNRQEYAHAEWNQSHARAHSKLADEKATPPITKAGGLRLGSFTKSHVLGPLSACPHCRR